MISYILPHWLAQLIYPFIFNTKLRHIFRKCHDRKYVKKYLERYYKDRYPDVKETGLSAFEYYIRFGKGEGRYVSWEDEIKQIQKINKDKIAIITTKEKESTAFLLKEKLSSVGVFSEIFYQVPDSATQSECIHIILSPQSFKIFPKNYFLFLSEEKSEITITSREYLKILSMALGIFLPNEEAINYFTSYGFYYRQLFYLPFTQRISEGSFLSEKEILEQYTAIFDFYFYRFLLAFDFISYDTFYSAAGCRYSLTSDKVCLGLTEVPERRKNFLMKESSSEFFIAEGLRHYISWIGCGLSYKFLIQKAQEKGLPDILICEDDVVFSPEHSTRFKNIRQFLQEERNRDIFSGIIADIQPNTHIKNIFFKYGECFADLDKFVSMVFNIYHASCYRYFISWDYTVRDLTNTIDRFLEKNSKLTVRTTKNFLVDHSTDKRSTLWGTADYTTMIENSSRLLSEKIHSYLAAKSSSGD